VTGLPIDVDVNAVVTALLLVGGAWCLVAGWRLRVASAGLSRRLDTFVAQSDAVSSRAVELPSLRERVVAPFIAWTGKMIHGLLPDRQIEQLRERLAIAGFPARRHLASFLAAKGLLAMGGAALGLVNGAPGGLNVSDLVVAMVYAVVGFYVPGIWLGRRMASRRVALARALPDALDLLSIGVGAGLGFDGALLEVTQRWENALTEEFALVLRDLRLGKGRRDAFRALAARTDSPDVRLFVASILQADQLGTPLREVLRVQAEQIRLRRRQRAEETGRKASIKMLIPMVTLIFPVMLIVLVGPAVPALMQFMKH
jgi:tight adherence protein C